MGIISQLLDRHPFAGLKPGMSGNDAKKLLRDDFRIEEGFSNSLAEGSSSFLSPVLSRLQLAQRQSESSHFSQARFFNPR